MKKALKYLFWLAVAVLLMYFSLKDVEWDKFLDSLRQCRWGFIVAGIGALICAYGFRGLRWRHLMRTVDPSTRWISTFNGVNIGNLANFVFPRLGEFVRCGYVARHTVRGADGKHLVRYDKVFGTALLDRIMDISMLFVILLTLLVVFWGKFRALFGGEATDAPHSLGMTDPSSPGASVGASGGLNMTFLWVVLILVGALLVFVLVACIFRNRHPLFRKIADFIKGIWTGFKSCLHMQQAWKVFAYTGCVWLMYWTMGVCITYAAPVANGVYAADVLSPLDALFLLIAGSIGMLIPVPGGFGSFHLIVAAALVSPAIFPALHTGGLDMQAGQAMIFAVLAHESQALAMIIGGVFSYIYEVFRKD